MYSQSLLLKSLLLCTVSFSLSSAVTRPRDLSHRTLYFQDNDPAGNAIIALKISQEDGTLSSPVKTPTGGKGLAGLVAISQDSVVVYNDLLLTTNAGDATLSLFKIDPNDPYHPKLVGRPAPTLGKTPTSVAYSHKLKTACAVNAGSLAGVTCFSVSKTKGLTPLGPLRFIPQTELADPLPPPMGPLTIANDIAFNPSSTALFVAVRSNGQNPGLLYAYPIIASNGSVDGQFFNRTVGRTPVVTSLPDVQFLFSLNFLSSDRRAFVTNPLLNVPGAAILDISYPSLKASVEKIITIPGQMAACWIAYSPQYTGNEFYVVDALEGNITTVDTAGNIRGQISYPVDVAGGQDTKFDRKWLYVLNDGMKTVVNVFKRETTGLKQVQAFQDFSAIGSIPNWMGLAIWPASS